MTLVDWTMGKDVEELWLPGLRSIQRVCVPLNFHEEGATDADFRQQQVLRIPYSTQPKLR